MKKSDLKIVALTGGVGGAKLAHGLAQVLQPENLTIIVNTGDDFTHCGLYISPDLDTVCYTLAGLANPATGWGRNHDTFITFTELKKLGMPEWFQLGDVDLATHIVRTIRLNEGQPLSQITIDFCRIWGVKVNILPMTDDLVQTWVYSSEGDLEFQEYFVHRRCEPKVIGFRFEGAEKSKPAPGVLEAIDRCDAVIICPSNPWVSIDPILAVPNIQKSLEKHLVFAVSPIIKNKAVKGPAAKMFQELGIEPSVLAVARHYGKLIQYLAIDISDNDIAGEISGSGVHTYTTNIFMKDNADRCRLGEEIVNQIIQVKGYKT